MAWFRSLFIVCVIASSALAAPPREGVNAVLGDDSWVARFGAAPGADADETLRLRVHLEHVEALLRARAPSGASEAQRAERARNLDRLRAYIGRGEFPTNRTFAGRRPHFIDEDGRICAVGYLIEQSAGREVAERINRAHEWDYIPDIRGIDGWVEESGLTLTELAMIQPAYGGIEPMPMPPPPPPDEGIRQRVARALDRAAGRVQECADHHEWWRTSVTATVTVFRFGTSVRVEPSGSRGFRRCVQRVVERQLAGIGLSRRTRPLTLHHAFVLDPGADFVDPDDGHGWAQPPPR